MKRESTKPGRLRGLACLSLTVLLILSGCNLPGAGPQDNAPTITVRQPVSGTSVSLGTDLKIVAQASDDNGVVRVELWVDGQQELQNPAPNTETGLKNFNAAFSWAPLEAGQHVIQLKSVDTAQQIATSDEVLITVQAIAQPTAQPTSQATATSPSEVTATVVAPTAGATPTAGVSVTPAQQPAVTADTQVNVRTGPGTGYTVLGQLDEGETVRATGRNADSTWWQIAYVGGTDDKAWVFGELVTANAAAESLPEVQPPAAPTASPTRVATTAPPSPQPSATPNSVLRADRTTIAAGECTTLRWDVDGVTAVYLNNEGVAGHDSRQVCPAATTIYELRVERTSGTQTYTLTITVTGTSGCTGEPIIEHALEATASSVAINVHFSIVWRVLNIRGIWIIEDDTTSHPVEGTGNLNGNLAFREFSYGQPGIHTYQMRLEKCDGTVVTPQSVSVSVHN